MSVSKALRLFVAMPGTTMGPHALFSKPESVQKNLLLPLAKLLEERTGRAVELVIEKEKLESGVIHETMFAEAWDADVYIADLTGANPNVYLELGVRWALRDGVTVLLAQGTEDLRFNVAASRAIIYHPDNLMDAIRNICTVIENGLASVRCDNPVRLTRHFEVLPQREFEELKREVGQLRTARGEDLLRAARAAENTQEKLKLLNTAVEISPASVAALLELAMVHQSLGEYPRAIDILRRVQQLDTANAGSWRELGVCYAKSDDLDSASAALREAVRLDPRDAEAWSNLGGVQRRRAVKNAAAAYVQTEFEESRRCYDHAYELNEFSLYAGLNVARVELLLSKWEPRRAQEAENRFRIMLHLCRYMIERHAQDYWRRFDLAEILLFCGSQKEARAALKEAVSTVPADERKHVLSSVLGPLRDYMQMGVMTDSVRKGISPFISLLESSV